MRWLSIAFLVLAAGSATSNAANASDIFVGTTPCGPQARAFLDIPKRDVCEFIRWDLTLASGVNGNPPHLIVIVDYGTYGQKLLRLRREGKWVTTGGMPERASARVFGLEIAKRNLPLWRVTEHTVYFLDEDRRLLVGNGGFGYALSTTVAEKPHPKEGDIPELSYSLKPLATGPTVYGVFEGRTPCEIAQVLGKKIDPNCIKLKWRLTIFQVTKMRAPTSYRLEGALFPEGAREGAVEVRAGTPLDEQAVVLRLIPPEGEQPLHLMRGDDNVLFFLDRTGTLAPGNRDFNYVLTRRQP